MTAKDIVLKRYPNARSKCRPAMYEMGRSEPTSPERWEIVPFPELGTGQIGTGSTKDLAWRNAASGLSKD